MKKSKIWYQKNKEKMREYAQRPEVKARKKKYAQRPEIKARRKEYKKIRHQLNKQEKEKQRELQSSHVSTLKLNFDLSSFNCDDMCSEQIKKLD